MQVFLILLAINLTSKTNILTSLPILSRRNIRSKSLRDRNLQIISLLAVLLVMLPYIVLV